MEQDTTTLTDQPYDLSVIGNLDAASHLLGDEWYFASNDGNYQFALGETGQYIPRFLGDPTLAEWAVPLLSQELSTPQQDTSLANLASPPGSAEYRPESLVPQQASESTKLSISPDNAECRRSLSRQPEAKKRSVSYEVDSTR
jgi:hypothetical protein